MKPSKIVSIISKALFIPIATIFMLSKWNICDYITFISEEHRFDVGLMLYIAIVEAGVELLKCAIERRKTTIQCIFYENEQKEDFSNKPIISIDELGMGVASVYCHIVLEGNWKQIHENTITLDIPSWITMQIDQSGLIRQKDGKISWNLASLLPNHDNGKRVRVENRMKISFIRNSPNANVIELEPTITKKMWVDFATNKLTIQNMG